VNVLSGEKGKAGRTLKKLGEVAVDISPVATKVIDALNAKGVPFFNSLRPLFAGDRQPLSVTLLSSQQVQTASGLFNAVKKLKWIVPIATLILAAAAAAVSVRRRHTLVRVAVGGSIGTVAFLVALDLVRRVFVSKAVAEGINGQVSGIIFDTLLRFLRDGLWLELAALLVLAVALWLVGPARSAVSLRHRLRRVGR
jgi:hypothetical protein